MAHILFDGDIWRYPVLRSLFWQWNVTVGSLPTGDRAGCPATVEQCDAVVRVHGETDPTGLESGAMPDGAEREGEAAVAAAPLLIIGPGAVAASAWVVIPDPGPGGCRLQAALQSCRERARTLRGDSRARHDRDQFRDFLGHELRSPLTAVKTALTVLETEAGREPEMHRMLQIALRNLDRLAGTVEWSQELMSLSLAPPAAELGQVSLDSLTRALPDHLDVHLDSRDEAREIFTDPRLFRVLVAQMERVLSFACPASVPSFRWDFDSDRTECRLSARVAADPQNASLSRPASGGGRETADRSRDDGKSAELHQLVRMLISLPLTDVLGVRPRLDTASRGQVEISIGWLSRARALALTDPVSTV